MAMSSPQSFPTGAAICALAMFYDRHEDLFRDTSHNWSQTKTIWLSRLKSTAQFCKSETVDDYPAERCTHTRLLRSYFGKGAGGCKDHPKISFDSRFIK